MATEAGQMNNYTEEELRQWGQESPGLLWAIEKHISEKELKIIDIQDKGDGKGIIGIQKKYMDLWDYLRKALPEILQVMEEPIEKMPLMINHDDMWIKQVVRWRLKINK